MQKLTTSLALAISLGLAAFQSLGGQEQDAPQRKLNWKEREQLELEEQVEGTWMLMSYSTPDLAEDSANFQGWAMFRDGYMSWMVFGEQSGKGFFGLRQDISLEAMAFRYRIGPNLELQMASMLGFSTLNPDGALEFDDGRTAFNYRITIERGLMTLRAVGEETLRFRKLAKTEFPKNALRALRVGGDTDIFDEEF